MTWDTVCEFLENVEGPVDSADDVSLDRREGWEVREVDAEDPEPWARRVEAARRRQDSDSPRQ